MRRVEIRHPFAREMNYFGVDNCRSFEPRHGPVRGTHVRFGSKADMCSARRHVRFAPKSGRNSGHRMSVKGRALLSPVRSNVDLLRYGEGIVHIDAEIPDCALYLGVT